MKLKIKTGLLVPLTLAGTLLAAACGGGTSHAGGSQSPSTGPSTASASPTATASPSAPSSRGPRFTTGSGNGALGAPEHPQAMSDSATPNYQAPAEQNRWATDPGTQYYCHYYTAQQLWYADVCIHVDSIDSDNRPIVNMTSYQTGELLEQIKADPQFTIVRIPSDPMFNTVGWVSWPQGSVATAENIRFQLLNQTDWYDQASLQAVLAGGSAQAYWENVQVHFDPSGNGANVNGFNLGPPTISITEQIVQPNCTLPDRICYQP